MPKPVGRARVYGVELIHTTIPFPVGRVRVQMLVQR
jgi:hypothetical protein